MKMKVFEAVALLRALRALDGRTVSVKEGSVERVIFQAYKYDGAVKMKIARNIRKLAEIQKDYTTQCEIVRKEVAPLLRSEKELNECGEYVDRVNEMAEAEIEVDLIAIAPADLKYEGENRDIPNTVISGCMPLFDLYEEMTANT